MKPGDSRAVRAERREDTKRSSAVQGQQRKRSNFEDQQQTKKKRRDSSQSSSRERRQNGNRAEPGEADGRTEETPEYERKRRLNIQRNQTVMTGLGLGNTARNLNL